MEPLHHITTSAPGKLLLLGDHAVVYGYPCLVTAVDYRVFVEVSESDRDEFILPYNNGEHFITSSLSLFRERHKSNRSVCVKTWASYKESYGLGSSSAVTVAFVKALSELFAIKLSNQALFDLCYQVVLRVQEVGSGFDIAAAIYGNTLYFVTAGKIIKPLKVDSLPLIVAYSGIKADTAILVKQVKKLREEKPTMVNDVYTQSASLVEKGKDSLLVNDYKTFGRLMNENHTVLRQLKVSTPKLDELVETSTKAGAYGAKLSGAGGGDCMIALAPEEKRIEVEKALGHAGATVLSVTTSEEGVRIE